MKVEQDSFVDLNVSIWPEGEEQTEAEVQVNDFSMSFIVGRGMVFPGLEKGIMGAEVDQELEFTVPPEDGFGQWDERLVRKIDRKDLDNSIDYEVNGIYQTVIFGRPAVFRVKDADEESIWADFNHPLAGKNLHLKVAIKGVRPATIHELASLSSG